MVGDLMVSQEGIPERQHPPSPGPTRGGDEEEEAGCLAEKVPRMRTADEAVGPHSLWTGILMSPALGAIPQPPDATCSGK